MANNVVLLAQDEAMDPVLFQPRYTVGDAALSSYALMKLGATSAATQANGAGTDSETLTVDDASTLTVGGYIQIASTDPVRVKWINPFNNTVGLWDARTWADNAAVVTVAIAAETEPDGLTLNTSTGELSGTPTTVGITEDLLVRAEAADGQTADSNIFDIAVETPPIPPEFDGPISNEAFLINDTVALNWGDDYFTGADSYALTGTLPTGLSFNTSTGAITGVVTQNGSFGPFTVTGTNSAGSTDSNAVTLTVSLGTFIGSTGSSYAAILFLDRR